MLPRVNLVEGEGARYLLFSTKDLISSEIFHNGAWDDNAVKVSRMFYGAADAPFVIDIGANLGAYAVPVAKDLQARNGSVFAFEPQRIIFYQLCANIFLNRLDNCYALNQAVSDFNEKLSIPELDYSKVDNIGAFSVSKESRVFHGIEASSKGFEHFVEAICLDDFNVEKAPSLIKIDVEGHELKVLRGATRFLKAHNYPPLLFESWNFDWFKDEKKKLMNFVSDLGYEYFEFEPTNYIAQHPNHSLSIRFTRRENVIHMDRIR